MPESASSRKPAQPSGRFRRLAGFFFRRGCGHTFAVLHNLFNFALLALVGGLVLLLLRDDLPVPDFLRDRIEHAFTERGFALRVDSALIDPTAKVLAQGVTLAPDRFGGVVLTAGRVLAEFDRLKLLARRVELVQIDAENVRLICPASLSPTGRDETIVEIASLRLRQNDGVWRVAGIAAMIGPLELIARGTYRFPVRETAAPQPQIDRLLDWFARYAPRAVRELAPLRVFERPRLELSFHGGSDEPLTLDTIFSATGFEHERWGRARDVRAATQVTLRGDPTTAPVRLTVQAEQMSRGEVKLEDVELVAEWFAFPTAQSYLPWQVHVAAARLSHPKGAIAAPVAALYPLAFPYVDIVGAANFEGEPLALAVEADLRRRSGTLRLTGGFGRDWLAFASKQVGRDVTYYATIRTPPDLTARAVFTDNLQFERMDFRLCSPAIVARHVPLDRVRVRGQLTRDEVRIERMEFNRGGQWGRGTYASDFKTRDYRFMITGSIRPNEIAPWYGPWWGKFWNDYAFKGAPPVFDVDVHGNWLRPEPILISGSGRADNVVIRGVAVNTARTHLFVRPNYFDLFEATILRAEGRVDGSVQLRFVRGDPNPVEQHFAFSSNADLVELARIFGPGGEKLLAAYRYTVPPNITLVGDVLREGSDYDVRLELGLNTGDEFRYLDFPLSWLTTRASIHNRQVVLPEIYAGYARGVLTGSAAADNGHLNFDAKLVNADFDLAMKIYSDFVDRNFPSPPEPAEAGSIVRDNYGGKLNLSLAAQGPLTDLKAYEGTGDLHLTGAKLYQLNVIGVFSDLFGTGIGQLGFTDAKGPFEVRRDRIHFPDLRVTGETARIEATGDYSLADKSIDFRVRMKPLRESPGLITKLFGVVVNPLTNLLFEARLTGTLRNPKRSIAFLAPRAPEPSPDASVSTPPPPQAALPLPADPAQTSPETPDAAPAPETPPAPPVHGDSAPPPESQPHAGSPDS